MIGHMLWHEPPPIEWFSNKKPQTHTRKYSAIVPPLSWRSLKMSDVHREPKETPGASAHAAAVAAFFNWAATDDDVIHHVLGVAYPIIPLDQFYKIETVFKFETTLTLKCVAPVFKALDIRGLVLRVTVGAADGRTYTRAILNIILLLQKEKMKTLPPRSKGS